MEERRNENSLGRTADTNPKMPRIYDQPTLNILALWLVMAESGRIKTYENAD